jgi:drug/metabolite transporter (DMT)-like permease
MVLHAFYHFFLLRMYRFGDLSQTYPIARGMSPLLVGGLSAVFVGELLAPKQTLGLVLACASIASLARLRHHSHDDEHRAIFAALATGMMIGMYTFVDGQGVRLAGGAERYIAWHFFFDSLPIVAAALWLRGAGVAWRYARSREGRRAFAGGFIGMVAYSIVLWALSQGAMALVSALRETSVIFAALIGTRLLGESFGRTRLIAAAGVAAGVMLLNS